MSKCLHFITFFLLIIYFFSTICLTSRAVDVGEERRVYIIHMGRLPEGEYLARSHHISLLKTIGHTNKMVEENLLRSYTRSFNGFAANLNPYEATKLEGMEGVANVFISGKFKLQTTRSWDYVGLSLDVDRNLAVESDIIIGHLDTGVLPLAESFSDNNLGPIPTKWRGACLGGKNFTCNKKLIGARYYMGDTARDGYGHGTHTASTVAGRLVNNANYFDIANGTARGGVPSARIATYKVCDFQCEGKDIMAGFDDAIADNVDIITISIGAVDTENISVDEIAIGSFHAMEKGILTTQPSGNTLGNILKSICSYAPWLFTVGASSMDRKIINKLVLEDGRSFTSVVVDPFDFDNQNKELVFGKAISHHHCNESSAMQCMDGCLDPLLVKEKIVVCDTTYSLTLVMDKIKAYNASGLILRSDKVTNDTSEDASLPTAILNDSDFEYVLHYLKSKQYPSARILKSETIYTRAPIPFVASFSGTGPNPILPEVFKPDLIAPGIDILAAGHPLFGSSKFQFRKGTSMACPHAAGAFAYVKSKRPYWSISAIKSSLMTTALSMDEKYNVDAELSYGAGHIDPLKALDPGLVYETFIHDYFNMFCSLGSEGTKLRKMFGAKTNCSNDIRTSPKDLNYPGMTAPVHSNSNFTIQFPRVVTNVGHVNSTYKAQMITGDSTIHIKVEPRILIFANLNETKNFVVTISGQWLKQDHVSCSLIWFDGIHRVKSPIILYRSSLL